MADHTPEELKDKFWSTLTSQQTVMLGLPGQAAGRPMTAMNDDDQTPGPLYFFTSSDTDLGEITGPTKAEMVFVSKHHDLFATAHGSLVPEPSREMIDKLWNPFVAAWFEGGKDDPKIRLLRLDGAEAEIWLDSNSLVAGAKMLLGSDPKKDLGGHNATVSME
ncbi:pyridoxamine 5'-phosphate oxidase family protein [Pseudoroseicyclus tamaricis]|uniref:Pyridoxamine 5'-phosphate oxidase family protein n=1 Tax=Pseudoroseicyclus tamaricis TaxID=2705421 RepID=A0A6B2JNM8_9RHOB|nr:pyridoxamine 5'-phosphate oxidase family protein [Pseudoroseicyclus tamaricis]NDU99534.1 pyridoxamine 5'-phosphate oxidase family protein [Pseudoroseicyclus tamaricis]